MFSITKYWLATFKPIAFGKTTVQRVYSLHRGKNPVITRSGQLTARGPLR